MKLHYRLSMAISVLIFLLSFAADPSMAQVSRPGEYSGYSSTLYSETVRTSQYVAARDGTKLAVDVLRPAKGGIAVNTPYPVLWVYNWGGRTTNGRHAVDNYAEIVKYGYVVAFADARGTGTSYGAMIGSYARIEAQDAYDLTEWLGTQSWSNEKVGMMGCSHSGQIEWLAAGMKPPHLKAIFPQCYSFDYYFGKSQGGIPGTFRSASSYEREKTSVPVDEDPTGVMRDDAVEQHKKGQSDHAVFHALPFRDSYSPVTKSKAWEEASPGTYFRDIQAAGIPIYQWASWNDFATKVMRDAFIFSANVNSVYKTSVGPLGHCAFGKFDIPAEERRWFDYWLKGIDNGIINEPPIYFNILNAEAGKEWRFSWKWPLPGEKRVTYYLAQGPSGSANPGTNDGVLSPIAPKISSAKDNYSAHYAITPATRDAQGITYTTPALPSDIELVGYVNADIWVSSSATDQDFFAFLEDIDGAGKTTVITQFQLRGSHRALSKPSFNNMGLPWRANLESEAAPLPPNQPVELVFDPMPVSYIVKTAHRIRLTIVNSYPPYAFLKPEGATVGIYRDARHASSISLPITTDPIEVGVDVKPETLDLKSKKEFSISIVPSAKLGKGYRAEDIDVGSLMCNGTGAVSYQVVHNALVAKFNIQDLGNASTGRSLKLDVTGKFRYDIPFAGSKTVRVIRPQR
jgi:predicted acyl esterase